MSLPHPHQIHTLQTNLTNPTPKHFTTATITTDLKKWIQHPLTFKNGANAGNTVKYIDVNGDEYKTTPDFITVANEIAEMIGCDKQMATEALHHATMNTAHEHAKGSAIQYFFQIVGKVLQIDADAIILAERRDVDSQVRRLLKDEIVNKIQMETLQKDYMNMQTKLVNLTTNEDELNMLYKSCMRETLALVQNLFLYYSAYTTHSLSFIKPLLENEPPILLTIACLTKETVNGNKVLSIAKAVDEATAQSLISEGALQQFLTLISQFKAISDLPQDAIDTAADLLHKASVHVLSVCDRLIKGYRDEYSHRQYFLQFLEILALTYSPGAAIENRYMTFVRWAAESVSKEFYMLLESICRNDPAFSKTACQLFNVPNFMMVINKYSTMLRESGNKYIDPMELEVLKAGIDFIATVLDASYDDVTRLMRDNYIDPLSTFFNFLGCVTTPAVKGSCFVALACSTGRSSLSRTENQKHNIWQLLEKHQIISTTNQANSFSMRMTNSHIKSDQGILVELETIESPQEMYPATRGFITLLNALIYVSSPVPIHVLTGSTNGGMMSLDLTLPLDLGDNKSGVIPYLNFVIDNVFLKAFHRAYLNPKELWDVLELCLVHMERCLYAFDLSGASHADALTQAGHELNVEDLVRHPGYVIMKHLVSGGRVVETLFRVLKEGQGRSVLLTQRILLRALTLQLPFLDGLLPAISLYIRTTGRKVPVMASIVALDQFMAYRTFVVVALMHLVDSDDPEIVLLAIKLIALLSTRAAFKGEATQSRIVALITQTDGVRIFVERLSDLLAINDEESAAMEEHVSRMTERLDRGEHSNGVANAIRESILDLCLNSLGPQISLSHLLLGFDTAASLHLNQLQDPPNSIRHCLHVIIEYLNSDLARRDSSVPITLRFPMVTVKCWELIYRLLAAPETNAPIVRYLQKNAFLQKHFQPLSDDILRSDDLQSAYALQNISIVNDDEITVPMQFFQKSWLLRCSAIMMQSAMIQGNETFAKSIATLLLQSEKPTSMLMERFVEIEILDQVHDVSSEMLAHIDTQRFKRSGVQGVMEIDVRAVYAAYSADFKNRREPLSCDEERQLNIEAEQRIYFEERQNAQRRLIASQLHALSSWVQAVSVATSNPCFDDMVLQENTYYLIFAQISAAMKHSTATAQTLDTLAPLTVLLISKIQEASTRTSANVRAGPIARSERPQEHLYDVLNSLCEIVGRPSASFAVRGCTYVALSDFIQYMLPSDDTMSAVSSSRRRQLTSGAISVLSKHTDRLMVTIANDTLEGTHVWKTLAMTCLSTLLSLFARERSPKVLQFIVRQNVIRRLVEWIRGADSYLKNLLAGDTADELPLWIYESTMSLFGRVAQTKEGALKLIDSGLISRLCDVGFLKERYIGSNTSSNYALNTFQRLLHPVLQLLLTILTTIGQQEQIGIQAVSNFVAAHDELIFTLLNNNIPKITHSTLIEIRYLTGIIYFLSSRRSQNGQLIRKEGENAIHDYMLKLASKYFMSRRWAHKLMPISDTDLRDDRRLIPSVDRSTTTKFRASCDEVVRGICRNILGYCQITTDQSNDQSIQEMRPVFGYSLSIAKDNDQSSGKPSFQFPSLGLMCALIQTQVQALSAASRDYKKYKQTSGQVAQLSPSDVLEYAQLANEENIEDQSAARKQEVAASQIEALMREKIREISTTYYNVELGLVLILRHLEYYLLQYHASSQITQSFNAHNRKEYSMFQPDTSELDILKSDVGSVLGPTLTTLSSMKNEQLKEFNMESRQKFIDLLIRKLQDVKRWNIDS